MAAEQLPYSITKGHLQADVEIQGTDVRPIRVVVCRACKQASPLLEAYSHVEADGRADYWFTKHAAEDRAEHAEVQEGGS